MNWSITFNQVSGRLGDTTGRNYVRKLCTTMLFPKQIWPFGHGSTKILQPKASFAQVRPFWQATLIRTILWFTIVGFFIFLLVKLFRTRRWKIGRLSRSERCYGPTCGMSFTQFVRGPPSNVWFWGRSYEVTCYWSSIHQQPQSKKMLAILLWVGAPCSSTWAPFRKNPGFWWKTNGNSEIQSLSPVSY